MSSRACAFMFAFSFGFTCYYCLFTTFQKLHFATSHFSERPQEKIFPCHHFAIHKTLKVPQKFRLTDKNLCQKIILKRAFSILKMSVREVTIGYFS